jgi:hypothetical protein
MKNKTTPNSRSKNAAGSSKPQTWLRSLFGPVIVGLIVLAGQIFVDPIVAQRVKIRESITQKRYEACEKAIELLQRRLASVTITGQDVPAWYTQPEKNLPTQLELNVAYNLLLIYGKSQTIAQEFFDATGPGKTQPGDIVRFLSAVRKELGVDEKASIDMIQYRLLRPVGDDDQMDNKAKYDQNQK